MLEHTYLVLVIKRNDFSHDLWAQLNNSKVVWEQTALKDVEAVLNLVMLLLHKENELSDVSENEIVPFNDSAEVWALHSLDAHDDKQLVLICQQARDLTSSHSKCQLETRKDKHYGSWGCLELEQVRVVLDWRILCVLKA